MPALESRAEGVWFQAQSAKGTPAASTNGKQIRKVGGDLNPNRDDGNENYSDGQRFPSAADFVNTISGEGNPVAQATPDISAALAWIISGQETVTGSADPFQHVATPGTASLWSTWWKKVGQTVGPLRQQFNDARMTSLRIEGSTANKVVKLTPGFLSVDPGVTFTTDPTGTIEADNPFYYTEGEGRFTIDGTPFRAHSSFAFVINDGVTAWYGDSAVAQDVIFGTASITLEGITILVDAQGLQRYNTLIYGQPNPPANTRPIRQIPALGSYTVDLQRGRTANLAITGVPTGGTFTITVTTLDALGNTVPATTAGIPYNATAAQLKAAIELLPNVPAGSTNVTGTALPTGPLKVEFVSVSPSVVPTAVSTGLTGGTTPTATFTDLGIRRQLKIEVPGVKWSPDVAVAGNPDGGPVELAMGAEARKVSGQPMYQITCRTPSGAFTAG